ncbi:MAG: gamma-glutamyl-gamma-aminobutyrate hydrolase family protein [Rhodothermales bacterium]|nr:gamma-glutamyl-gamma-aminobutyrate hydrolase family protein [Rhodothermales bacterium]
MDQPVIGITTSFEEDQQRLHHGYVRSVERAGGFPLIIPFLENDENLARLVSQIDGLVISGGPAIDIGLIGDLPPDLPATPEPRRSADLRVLELFLEKKKPILGICYGMQLVNALAGGSIYADIQQQVEGIGNHSSTRGATSHFINVDKESALASILGGTRFEVNTRHIQALESPGTDFKISARADDGVIEAIENTDGTILGVQFHPERMDTMVKLFEHLVQNARRSRDTDMGK